MLVRAPRLAQSDGPCGRGPERGVSLVDKCGGGSARFRATLVHRFCDLLLRHCNMLELAAHLLYHVILPLCSAVHRSPPCAPKQKRCVQSCGLPHLVAKLAHALRSSNAVCQGAALLLYLHQLGHQIQVPIVHAGACKSGVSRRFLSTRERQPACVSDGVNMECPAPAAKCCLHSELSCSRLVLGEASHRSYRNRVFQRTSEAHNVGAVAGLEDGHLSQYRLCTCGVAHQHQIRRSSSACTCMAMHIRSS